MKIKNNERTSLRRRTNHLVKRAKLKQQKQEELDSILECTHQGQINKDFTPEINKDKMLEELKTYNVVTRTQQSFKNEQPTTNNICIIC